MFTYNAHVSREKWGCSVSIWQTLFTNFEVRRRASQLFEKEWKRILLPAVAILFFNSIVGALSSSGLLVAVLIALMFTTALVYQNLGLGCLVWLVKEWQERKNDEDRYVVIRNGA